MQTRQNIFPATATSGAATCGLRASGAGGRAGEVVLCGAPSQERFPRVQLNHHVPVADNAPPPFARKMHQLNHRNKGWTT